MTPRERAEALYTVTDTNAGQFLRVENGFAVDGPGAPTYSHALVYMPTRAAADAWVAWAATPIAAAIESALAEQAAGEAERIAAAEMARDVALVEAARDASDGAHVVARVLGIDWGTARYLVCNAMGTPDDVTAAIRAARKVKP